MKPILKAFALPVVAIALSGVPAFAQDHPDQDRHDNNTYRTHSEWKKGSQISQDDWNRGDKVDYKEHHLRRPPEGHEWRKIDGNYVMAKQDGTIVSTYHPSPRNHEKSPEHPQ